MRETLLFGHFWCKTQWIIGEKSQISARFYISLLRKCLTPHPKSHFVPQISPRISSILLTFMPYNLKNTIDYRSKSQKSAMSYSLNLRKIYFLGIFYFKLLLPIVESFTRVYKFNNFKTHTRLSGKNVNKCSVV